MKKIIKKIRRSIGRRIPEDIKSVIRRMIRKVKPVGNPTIPVEELKIFTLLQGNISTVFDIGTREDLSFYKIKPQGSYHLFEPSKKAIVSLKEQIAKLKNADITLNEFGLSDKSQDNCIYYEDSQSFVINPFHKGIDKGIRYSLRTLDEYTEKNNIAEIDFLKIDTEGLDYRILLGGLRTVKTKVKYVQFEYWDGVQKFIDLLGDTFNLYLMMEPRLLEGITEDIYDTLTESQKNKNYKLSVIPLDDDITDLIDRKLAPFGYGGNILGVSKKIPQSDIKKITFPVNLI